MLQASAKSLTQRMAESLLQAASILRYKMIKSLGLIESKINYSSHLAKELQAALISRHVSVSQLLRLAYHEVYPNILHSPSSGWGKHLEYFINDYSNNCSINKNANIELHEVLSLPIFTDEVVPKDALFPDNCSENDYILELIVNQLKNGSIKLSNSIFIDLLNNVPIPCFQSDIAEVLDFVESYIKQNKIFIETILKEIQIYEEDNILHIVTKILEEISYVNLSGDIKLQISVLLSYFRYPPCTFDQEPSSFHDILDIIRDDEFPQDVTDAKDIMLEAFKSNKWDISQYTTQFLISDYKYDKMDILLALLQRLNIKLPNTHPASTYVKTLLIHVKMRQATLTGVNFTPQSLHDIKMLLNSFGSTGIDLTDINSSIYNLFRDELNWREVFINFPFHRYSKPRTLIKSMIEKILETNLTLKLCYKITLQSFLDKVNDYEALTCVKHNCVTTPSPVKLPVTNQCCDTINIVDTASVFLALKADTPFYMFSTIYKLVLNLKFQLLNHTYLDTCANVLIFILEYLNKMEDLDTDVKSIINLLKTHIDESNSDKVTYLNVCKDSEIDTVIIKPIQLCLISEGNYLWVNTDKLLDEVKPEIKHSVLKLIDEYFKPDVAENFHLEYFNTKAELLKQLLWQIKAFKPLTETQLNDVNAVIDNITNLDNGSELPDFVCINKSNTNDTTEIISSEDILETERNITTNIVIETPKPCFDLPKGSLTYIIKVGPWFQKLSSTLPRKEILNAILHLTSSNVEESLKKFNFDKYENQNDFFIQLLMYLYDDTTLNDEEHKATENLLKHITTMNNYSEVPDIMVKCFPTKEAESDIEPPGEHEDTQTEEPTWPTVSKGSPKFPTGSKTQVILGSNQTTPSYSPYFCPPGTQLTVIIDIKSLLSTVMQSIPHKIIESLKMVLSDENIISFTQKFNVTNFKTKAELLKSILKYLIANIPITETDMEILIYVLNNIDNTEIGMSAPVLIYSCTRFVTTSTMQSPTTTKKFSGTGTEDLHTSLTTSIAPPGINITGRYNFN